MLSEMHPPEYHQTVLSGKEQLERDPYDEHSVYCMIKLEDKIVGTGRVILGQNSKHDYSLKAQKYSQYFFNKFSYSHIPIEKIGEFSRLFVLPEYRNSGAFLAILRGRVALCSQYNITHIFLDAEPSLVLKYQEYGLDYEKISEEYNDAGVIRATYFISLSTFLNNLHEKNRELWRFITQEGKYYPYETNQIAGT